VHSGAMVRTAVLGPLETGRLVLRPQQVGDAAVFHQLWSERDPRVPAHRHIVDGRPTVDDIAGAIAGDDPGVGGPRLLTVVLRSAGAAIGYCGLNAHGNGSPAEPELAYELLRREHGHGYATEAGRAVVDWAQDAGYARLWAGVWDWNHASRRVLSKLGFRELRRTEPSSDHGCSLLAVRDLTPSPGLPACDERSLGAADDPC
jgi:[ribosomal protein S5]-alanine N-acetyltransferase